jgi:hypothetical protein
MAAGGAIEPIVAEFALDFRKSLFLFALGTTPVHLAILQVFREEKAALGALLASPFFDLGATVWSWADKDGFAVAAPVFPFFHFTANRAFFHSCQSFYKMVEEKKKKTGWREGTEPQAGRDVLWKSFSR